LCYYHYYGVVLLSLLCSVLSLWCSVFFG
jgi:hypothetical protein